MHAYNPGRVTLASRSWYGVLSSMVGVVNWWCLMEPSTTIVTSGFTPILFSPGRNFVYVQDKCHAPHNTCTNAFLAPQDVGVMDWSARSTNMHHIGYVWDQIGVWIWDMYDPPSTVSELRLAVLQEWVVVHPRRVWILVKKYATLCACSACCRRGRGSHKLFLV